MKIPSTKKLIIYTGFILVGLTAGFLYWKFVGCTSGSCAMKSNPYYTTMLGGFFGYLIPDTIFNRKRNQENK